MTCEHERCYSHETVEAMLAARADDLAQLTAAVAAIAETVRLQALAFARLEGWIDLQGENQLHHTEAFLTVTARLNDLGERIDRLQEWATSDELRIERNEADLLRLRADVRRQMGGER